MSLVAMDTINVSPTFHFEINMSIEKQYKDYPERFAD